MNFARQSTAITYMVGPVLDADGVAVTDCVIGDFKFSKNGAAPAAFNASATLTHRHTGFYSLAATATDTNTVGTFQTCIDDTVNACPMHTMQVVEEAIYDALFAGSANAFAGAAGSSTVVFSNTSIATAAAVTTVNGLAANVITAAATAADFTTEIQAGLATAAALTTVDTVVDAIQAKTDALPTDPADQSLIIAATDAVMARLGAPAGASVSADVAAVKAQTAAIETDTAEIGAAGAGLTALATAANLATVDTVVDGIKAKTDSLTFTVAGVVDANVENVNDVPIVGDGSATPFGPA